jgi:hypothetical protein
LRVTLEPLVELSCHRRKKFSLVDALPQMVTVGPAAGVSGRHDLNCRHELTNGVYDLLGNALGLLRTGLGLLEARIEFLQRLIFCGESFATANGLNNIISPLTLLRRCHSYKW